MKQELAKRLSDRLKRLREGKRQLERNLIAQTAAIEECQKCIDTIQSPVDRLSDAVDKLVAAKS